MEINPISQRDPLWINIKLGTSSTTIGSHGCTITCLTMLLNYYGYNETPATVNEKLKNNNGYSNGNLLVWTSIPNIWSRMKFEWRGTGYDNDYVSQNLPCLVEVDFDNLISSPNDKHWVIFKGNKRMNDPWTGLDEPTTKYSILRGYAIITGTKPETGGGNNMSTILNYLNLNTEDEAKSKIREHLGEKDSKCNWGQEGDNGGFLGSARKEITKLRLDLGTQAQSISKLEDDLSEATAAIEPLNTEISRLTKKQTELGESLMIAQGKLDTIKRVGYKSFNIPVGKWDDEKTILSALDSLSSGGNPDNLSIPKLLSLILTKLGKLINKE